jgi:hypothetical protein
MTKVIENEELHDELVEDVEVTDEELLDEAKKVAEEDDMEDEESEDEEEMEEAVEDDAEEANAATAKNIKASAKGKSAEPKAKASVKEDAFKEDLDALVEGEATLSEDFRGKAGLIFEAALKTKLAEHVERLEETYAEQLAEETATIKADLVEKVDSYLGYVVESWMEDNKLAVETGLRADITESFMDALQGVFAQHYITVPEGKADLVEELAKKVESLEENYNQEVDRAVELNEKVAELTREKIIREAAEGLSEVQAEKLKGLVEDIDFDGAESFTKKVETLKESYFKAKTTIKEEAEEVSETEVKEVSDSMQRYLDALRKSH